jgi:putative phage-type endonuclease
VSLTDDQLAERRTMITASDISAILNLNPYRGPLEVWHEKRGERPPETMDPKRQARIEWGHLIEPRLRERYAARHGVMGLMRTSMTLRHPEIRHHGATPDGLVFTDRANLGLSSGAKMVPVRGWEGKTHSVGVRHLYGPPGTDEVPIHELLQCEWGMHVTGLARWDLTAFIDGEERDYVIERDDGLIDQLIERATEWWNKHVLGGERPEPTEADADLVKALHPRHTSNELVAATPEDLETVRLLESAVRNASDAKALVERLKTQLKARIGDAAGLAWGPGASDRITWKRSADSRGVVTDFATWRTSVQLAASSPKLATAATILRGLVDAHGASFVLESGPDAVHAIDLEQAIRGLLDAVAAPVPITTAVTRAGSRRFNTPRSWKRPGGDEDDDQ